MTTVRGISLLTVGALALALGCSSGEARPDDTGFTDDTDATSTCFEACADAWPPIIVDPDFVVGAGLDPAVFSTTERPDGSLQLVAGVWPLYLFAGDGAAGDLNGQGSGDV